MKATMGKGTKETVEEIRKKKIEFPTSFFKRREAATCAPQSGYGSTPLLG